jgi:hypothetical protein
LGDKYPIFLVFSFLIQDIHFKAGLIEIQKTMLYMKIWLGNCNCKTAQHIFSSATQPLWHKQLTYTAPAHSNEKINKMGLKDPS